MQHQEIILELLESRNLSQQQLAIKCDFKRQSNISSFLDKNKKGIRTDIFAQILKELDCELIVRSKAGANKNKEWVLTPRDEE